MIQNLPDFHKCSQHNLRVLCLISSPKDFLNAGYSMRVLRGSVYVGWFREARPGSAMHEVFLDMEARPELYYESYADQRQKLPVQTMQQ